MYGKYHTNRKYTQQFLPLLPASPAEGRAKILKIDTTAHFTTPFYWRLEHAWDDGSLLDKYVWDKVCGIFHFSIGRISCECARLSAQELCVGTSRRRRLNHEPILQ